MSKKKIQVNSGKQAQSKSALDSSTQNGKNKWNKTIQQKEFLNFLYINCNGKQPGKTILEIVAPGLGLSVH